jgi:hypothetical protein
MNERREIHEERMEPVKAFQEHWKPASEDYACRFNLMLTVGDKNGGKISLKEL